MESDKNNDKLETEAHIWPAQQGWVQYVIYQICSWEMRL